MCGKVKRKETVSFIKYSGKCVVFLDLCKKAIAKRKEVETSSTKTILYVYLNSCASQLDDFFYLKIVTFDKGSGKLLEARGFLFLHRHATHVFIHLVTFWRAYQELDTS